MKAAMREKTDAYWAERSDPTVFRTDAGQEAAQARSRKFFESADRVEFFEEADGKALNKVATRCTLGTTPRAVCYFFIRCEPCCGTSATNGPCCPSRYTRLQGARCGGAVTSHQDATFLRTDPDQTVVGLAGPRQRDRGERLRLGAGRVAPGAAAARLRARP